MSDGGSRDAAAGFVAKEQHWKVGGLGKAHIGNVLRAQIAFRAAAGTLDQDEVAAL